MNVRDCSPALLRKLQKRSSDAYRMVIVSPKGLAKGRAETTPGQVTVKFIRQHAAVFVKVSVLNAVTVT